MKQKHISNSQLWSQSNHKLVFFNKAANKYLKMKGK